MSVLLASITCLVIAAPTWAGPPTGSDAEFMPDPASVVRDGPAYRYPQQGWIVLHIDGTPYQRGRQHGRLLAAEIADYVQSLANLKSPLAPTEAWRDMRTLSNALFLRRYDAEYLEEMKGIADGAAAAGAKFDGRQLDLIDIVAVNSAIEVEFLAAGLEATANGLEGRALGEPADAEAPHEPDDHCSAFAAVGPATADGGIVFGHITMFKLNYVRHFNVWLDIQPAAGHRVLMQTYPGGIMSGLDYYMNDAGLLVAETTIRQTSFDAAGQTVASRIRRVVQYGDSIDEAVRILKEANNGLYSNEWLLADIKTNEIAMFELGTRASKLWRSANDEWPAGSKGFYWGCNNAKDPAVRRETPSSLADKPANLVFRPSERDTLWLRLFGRCQGRIDASFGFEAFTTPPLAAFPSCDAKFTTTALAKELKSWCLFGPPLGRTWEPTADETRKYSDIQPLLPNDWTLLGAAAPINTDPAAALAVDLKPFPRDEKEPAEWKLSAHPPAWHGTLLPKADGDIWLAAAFADYEKIVALENVIQRSASEAKLSRAARDRLEVALFAPRSRWLAAVRRLGRDVPLTSSEFDWRTSEWYDIAAGKGVLLLAALRGELGSEAFARCMDEFGRAHAGQPTSTADFLAAAERAAAEPVGGRSLAGLFDSWMQRDATPLAPAGCWGIDSFEFEPDKAIIIYGTRAESQATREAAELLRRKILRRGGNVLVPLKADSEAGDDDLHNRHLLLVGRPAVNTVTARCAESLPVRFGDGSFSLRGETYAHADSAIVVAGDHPTNPRWSVVVYAGLGARATRRAVESLADRGGRPAQVLLLPRGQKARRMCVADVSSK
ncbi:MAG TPA: C45 family autoproteolytic acyltransferase/hydrolase [Pirellulales bacterium]|nr:C45 family autoproteolytic acyltransferase/hydrolase [Pirellulales bacterium]